MGGVMAGAPNTHVCRHPRRTERRENAAKLAAERAKRSPLEQLALIAKRPGESKKERARLEKMVRGAP
jgi:hypothetical protein